MAAAPALPLAGVVVLEFAHTIMGPSCGVILADLGARVIKIEPPDGDQTRRLQGMGAGFFSVFNRNKESLALDLKSQRGLEIAYDLLGTADVLVENFAPSTMARLKLSYDALAKRFPRLIYCSLKGFLSGPYEHRLALDEVVQMMGGLAYMTGPRGRPLRAGSSVVDIMGGMFGVIGILSALRERATTGLGQRVQSALFESVVFLMAQHMAQSAVTGVPVPPMPERDSAWAIYEVFAARDGEQLFLGITNDRIWERFCAEFERPDLFGDERLTSNNDRIRERPWLVGEIAATMARYDAADILARCERAQIACSPIGRPEALFDDPHLLATHMLQRLRLPNGATALLPGLPLSMDGHAFEIRRQPPGIGEHTGALLGELGYDAATIAELAAEGVVTLGSAADTKTVGTRA